MENVQVLRQKLTNSGLVQIDFSTILPAPVWLLGSDEERDWKQEFLKMERQFSVGPDRPVKEDHLLKWTTLSGKFPPGPKRSICFWTETAGNFGIMEGNACVHLVWSRDLPVWSSCDFLRKHLVAGHHWGLNGKKLGSSCNCTSNLIIKPLKMSKNPVHQSRNHENNKYCTWYFMRWLVQETKWGYSSSKVIKGNGYEAWQTCSLCVFVTVLALTVHKPQ